MLRLIKFQELLLNETFFRNQIMLRLIIFQDSLLIESLRNSYLKKRICVS